MKSFFLFNIVRVFDLRKNFLLFQMNEFKFYELVQGWRTLNSVEVRGDTKKFRIQYSIPLMKS